VRHGRSASGCPRAGTDPASRKAVGSSTTSGFTRFVLWLGDGNLHADRHWEPQLQSMFPLHYYTDVLPQEDLSRELAGLLDRRGVAVPPGLLRRARPEEDAHNQHAERRLKEFYSAAARDVVAELYREDFTRLGYSTDITDAYR
jgi:hypothetical protein